MNGGDGRDAGVSGFGGATCVVAVAILVLGLWYWTLVANLVALILVTE